MLPAGLLSETLLTEPHRLAIVVALAGRPRSFVELRGLVGLTDGNLNRHLDKLARDDLVVVQREKSAGARSRTLVSLTEVGRGRLETFAGWIDGALTAVQAALAGNVSGEVVAETIVAEAPVTSENREGVPDMPELVAEHFAGPD